MKKNNELYELVLKAAEEKFRANGFALKNGSKIKNIYADAGDGDYDRVYENEVPTGMAGLFLRTITPSIKMGIVADCSYEGYIVQLFLE